MISQVLSSGSGVRFDPPRDWEDRSIIAFATPGVRNAPNVTVTQTPMREGDSLQQHADRQLAQLAMHLHDFDLVECCNAELGGQPAIRIRFAWVAHLGALEQSISMVDRSADGKRTVVAFTITSTRDDMESVRPLFAEVLKSVRFDDGAERRTASAPPPVSETRELCAPVFPMPGVRDRAR